MSTQIGETTHPKARKTYRCMASDWIVNGDLYEIFRGCTREERRAIVKARRNRWSIQPGQIYVRQAMVWDGRMGTFKAIPEMHDICLKYDLYEDC